MRKIALLIGVSEFDSGDLEPLPKALADVKAMEEVLLEPELGGFEESHLTVLKNPKRQIMEDAIYDIFNKQKSKRDDLLLFYFSGHGIVDESGIFYFSTRETRKDNGKLRPTTAVKSNYVHEYMNQCRSRRITIILDCCHSGAFAQGLTHKGAGNPQIKEQLGGEGRAILTAASMTQYAWSKDEYPLSAYTYFLLEGVKTGEADTDGNKYLSMEEIHEYAKKKVLESGLEMTPEFYPVREGGKIRLFKAKISPSEQYKREIESFIPQGNIPEYMKPYLISKREKLGLSEEEARDIENKVFAEVIQKQKHLDTYRKAVHKAFPEGSDINNSFIWNNLKKYQIHFQLEDEDVSPIHQEVRARLENSEQKRKQQEEEEKRRLEVEAKRQ
ncbi:MAG: caspase family protein, partial [Moorea sp. SIO2B7]|nr:caspase family protein [Moorena sp. SIO2B7]